MSLAVTAVPTRNFYVHVLISVIATCVWVCVCFNYRLKKAVLSLHDFNFDFISSRTRGWC